MDSAALLDLLGNENRRRILRLLARRPCYVTEISEYLGVSPKAVIDHLRKLEEAGLVESHTDESRRKYFHIARNLRLEVSVSPYDFGTKSAYAASRNLDIRTCRYLSLDVSVSETEKLPELAGDLDRLQRLQHELSLAQRWVHGRVTDTLDRLTDTFEDDVDTRLYTEVLATVAGGNHDTAEISARVDAPQNVVERTLTRLADLDVVVQTDDGWTISK